MGKYQSVERVINSHIIIPATLSKVWQAWTTEEGAKSFFAPKCNIDLQPGGAYEMFFNLDAEYGKQGGEGMIVMAAQLEQMLTFTWNAPPHLPNVRSQMTHVVIRMFETEAGETHVTLRHDGWGSGKEWDDSFEYFSRAWADVVLPRLRYRFESGPIDWRNPPSFHKNKEGLT